MENDRRPIIAVDADACPVKAEIVQAAQDFGVPVLFVASHAHELRPEPGVEIVQVDRSGQAADIYLANRIRPGNILVTQDFGLAALELARRAAVLSFRGQRYTPDMLDFLLERRWRLDCRRRGGGRTKGPKAMTNEDRRRFLQSLTKLLAGLQDN